MNSSSLQLCKYCTAIPFADLPSEERPALPHQPSLAALRTSATTCSLCSLILDAGSSVRTYVEIEHRGLSDGSMRSYDPSYELADGRKVMANFRQGHYTPGSDGLMSRWPENQPPSSKPPYPFGSDKTVRPWLFGNWWKLGESGPLQLIGLGVRFAPSPNIEDAEGNGQIKHFDNGDRVLIDYHGTFLRICAEDGMSNSFACFLIFSKRWHQTVHLRALYRGDFAHPIPRLN